MIQKSIRVPFIEGLEKMTDSQVTAALASAGACAGVDEVNWPEAYPYAPECLVRLARGDNGLAISFEVTGLDLRATALEDNGRSWEDSCCEFFISPGGDEYCNIEITCIGSVLIGRGSGRNGRILLAPEDVAKVRRWSSLEKRAYDEQGGTFSWSITALIPYSVIGFDPDNLPKEAKGNFYKCGDLTAHPHFVTWNPIKTDTPDFHRPEFFGTLAF